jgi:8-oxo-dGTP diphosphatase
LRFDDDRAFSPKGRGGIVRAIATEEKKPRLGCAGIVWRRDGVLLGKRNKDPNRGLWVLPGGGVAFGESFAETLRRELREETGIEVQVRGVLNVYELISAPNEHRVIVYLVAHHESGEPVAADDLSEVGFFTADDIRALSRAGEVSPFVEKVLQDAKLL